MARRTMPTCLAVLISACALMPSISSADHLRELVPITEQFRWTTERFEAIACRRPLTNQDLYRIKSLTRKACRLAEGVQRNAHRGRVITDLNAVRQIVRLVDYRINRYCRASRDPMLLRRWDAVKCESVTLERAISGCSFGACNDPPAVQEPVPRAIIPPTDARFDHRFRDPRNPRHRPPADYPRRDFGRYERYGRSSAPPWLDVLAALLSR